MPPSTDLYTLVSKYFAHQLEEEELEQLDRWKAAHPEEFAELQSIWQKQRAYKQPFRRAEVQQKLNQRIDALEAESHPMPQNNYFAYKIAASVSLLLLVAGFAYWLILWKSAAEAVVWIEKATRKSQVATFTLPDGSRVALNADSKFRYPASGQPSIREVFLDGEAFFEITPNPERPFVVRTGALTTRVLGTSFVVSAYPEDEVAKVAVVSGRVAVDLPEFSATVLQPNRQVVYHKIEKTRSEQAAIMANELAWTKGRLVFNATQLSQVARILERYYNVTVKLETEELKGCQVTATFEQETLFHVLESISYINALEYTFNEGIVTITGTGCQS
jgi:ferric-dicitrate binding protein FerR (iron transport regulator)